MISQKHGMTRPLWSMSQWRILRVAITTRIMKRTWRQMRRQPLGQDGLPRRSGFMRAGNSQSLNSLIHISHTKTLQCLALSLQLQIWSATVPVDVFREKSRAYMFVLWLWVADLLILHGLFPSAPAQPRFAVSIELLKLYHALFERSCDALNALAAALHTFYTRRGLHLLNNKVSERYIYTC
jgi:hypothetical protein